MITNFETACHFDLLIILLIVPLNQVHKNVMNDHNELKNKIKRVLITSLELNLHENEMEGLSELDELFGLDSLAILEFVLGLEQEFNFTFETQYIDLEIIRNLDRLAACIADQIKKS
ncbi:acyl carrier protein [candidate division CSSED10-310 bacterium]|uniref:Acyl carrier protein n=1 Tax=candidate division CSSED10-310 bacterium TaxID=2855610 RepID=A0ABV6YVJ9_UNCC1